LRVPGLLAERFKVLAGLGFNYDVYFSDNKGRLPYYFYFFMIGFGGNMACFL
jgi:hypothetical protein